MSHDGENGRERQFEREWRAWLDRPTRRTPSVAATRVSAMLAPRRRWRPLWAVTVAASVVLAAVTVFFRVADDPRLHRAALVPAPATESLKPGEVLMWLDSETPLYMHFQSPGGEGAN